MWGLESDRDASYSFRIFWNKSLTGGFKTPLNPWVGLGGVLLRGLTRGCQPLVLAGVILIDWKGEVSIWVYIKLNITDCLRLEIWCFSITYCDAFWWALQVSVSYQWWCYIGHQEPYHALKSCPFYCVTFLRLRMWMGIITSHSPQTVRGLFLKLILNYFMLCQFFVCFWKRSFW